MEHRTDDNGVMTLRSQKKWEYKTVPDWHIRSVPDYLNDEGREGWELVTINNHGTYIFKREVQA